MALGVELDLVKSIDVYWKRDNFVQLNHFDMGTSLLKTWHLQGERNSSIGNIDDEYGCGSYRMHWPLIKLCLCGYIIILFALKLLHELFYTYQPKFLKFIHRFPSRKEAIQNILSWNNSISGSRGLVVDDVYKSYVTSVVLISIENLHPRTSLTDVGNFLSKKSAAVRHSFLALALSTDFKAGQNKGVALLTIPRDYLEASQVLLQDGKELHGRIISVKEVKSRKYLTFKKSTWIVDKKEEHQHVCPIYKDIVMRFGYHQIDGGAYLMSLTQNIENAIEESAKTGIEKIVVKAQNIQEAKRARDWCKDYKMFLYHTTALTKEKGRYDFRKFKKLVDTSFCVGINFIPLCYRTSEKSSESREEALECFRRQIDIAVNHRKPMIFCLRTAETIHPDFLQTLRVYKNLLPPCQLEIMGSHHISHRDAIIDLIQEFDLFVAISAHHLNATNTFAWMRILLYQKKIRPNRIILHSDSPYLFYGREKPFKTEEDFLNNFRRSRQKFLHIEAVNYNIAGYHNSKPCSDPRLLHCTLEMISSVLDLHPIRAAAILKENAVRFYQFSNNPKSRQSSIMCS